MWEGRTRPPLESEYNCMAAVGASFGYGLAASEWDMGVPVHGMGASLWRLSRQDIGCNGQGVEVGEEK